MKIGFGCVKLGSASSSATLREQIRVVHAAIDSGVMHFDTADVYGSGASERVLGQALKGHRNVVTVSTKGGYVFRPRTRYEQYARRFVGRLGRLIDQASRPMFGGATRTDSHGSYEVQDFSPARLRMAVEASLRRLSTDYVDVYQLHGPPDVFPEVFEALSDLRCAGVVLRFGVGAESVSSAAAWTGAKGLDVLQLPFGLLDPQATTDVFDSARSSGNEIWARGVYGGGLLAAASRDLNSVVGHPKYDVIAAVLRIAQEAGMGVDELAVRWVLGHPDVATMLVGVSSIEHLHRNVTLADLPPLPDDVCAALTAVIDRGPEDESS
jgi:D-threo-aldose 1-dehydrogenase